MWKSREINCVLYLVIMYLPQKGKREHNSIITLKSWLTSKFFFSFFPIVAILSGTWAAGIGLGKISVPACTLCGSQKGSVWAALGASLENPAVWLCVVGFGKHRVPNRLVAIKKQQCTTPPILWQYFIDSPQQRPDCLSEIYLLGKTMK